MSNDQIESYLVKLGLPYELVDEGMWVIRDSASATDDGAGAPIVVHHQEEITVFRVKLMDKPATPNVELYERLLVLNAEEMLSGAYGIEEDSIVAVETLQSENLDFNEFQAAVESMFVALTEHYPVLRELRGTDASA